MMEFKIYGDSALLINFEQKIDRAVNDEVVALSQAIEKTAIQGVNFCVPTFCSITVGYDPFHIKYELLVDLIKRIFNQKEELGKNRTQRKLMIPVCYENPYSLDLDELEDQLKISRTEIIRLHTTSFFHVYMLGFLPGFAYMGVLPENLICPRKKIPRLKVPVGSVGLAGQQTGIYPLDAPGGWQIIGCTPLNIFDPKKENPFLFEAGDMVQFYAISKNDFEKMKKDIDTGNFNLAEIYG